MPVTQYIQGHLQGQGIQAGNSTKMKLKSVTSLMVSPILS